MSQYRNEFTGQTEYGDPISHSIMDGWHQVRRPAPPTPPVDSGRNAVYDAMENAFGTGVSSRSASEQHAEGRYSIPRPTSRDSEYPFDIGVNPFEPGTESFIEFERYREEYRETYFAITGRNQAKAPVTEPENDSNGTNTASPKQGESLRETAERVIRIQEMKATAARQLPKTEVSKPVAEPSPKTVAVPKTATVGKPAPQKAQRSTFGSLVISVVLGCAICAVAAFGAGWYRDRVERAASIQPSVMQPAPTQPKPAPHRLHQKRAPKTNHTAPAKNPAQ
jgi:hypothetical protein